MKCFTPSIRDALGPVKEALQETFLTALFQGLGEGEPGRGVTCLPAKLEVLSLPYSTKMVSENWTASCVITGHLVTALRGQEDLRTADHFNCLREFRMAVQKWSPGGDLSGGGCPSHTLTATCDEVRSMDDVKY